MLSHKSNLSFLLVIKLFGMIYQQEHFKYIYRVLKKSKQNKP